jgi:hypothetical protein
LSVDQASCAFAGLDLTIFCVWSVFLPLADHKMRYIEVVSNSIDCESKSPIFMFEKKIHIGNQTINNGFIAVKQTDLNPDGSPRKTDNRRRAAPWL